MKTYLILLNWVFIAAIIGICQWQHPLIAGWAFLGGFLMGAFSTVGLVTVQFAKDPSNEKEWRWRHSYFGKDYRIEFCVQLLLTATAFGLSLMFFRSFWLIGTGLFGAWFLNITVEWFWAATHRYYNNK